MILLLFFPLLLVPALNDAIREPVPSGALQRLGSSRFRAEDSLCDVFYTADEKLIIGCTNSCIILWDSQTGVRVQSIPLFFGNEEPNGFGDGPRMRISTLAYHPRLNRLAYQGYRRMGTNKINREIHILDLNSNRNIFSCKDVPFSELKWTPHGELVQVSWDRDKDEQAVLVRDSAGKELHRWSNFLNLHQVLPIEFCVLDRNRLAMFNEENKPVVRDLTTGIQLAVFDDVGEITRNTRLAATTDGKYLAVGGKDRCTIYDSATTKKISTIPGDRDRPNMQLAFSPDGRTLYYGSSDVRRFDKATGNPNPANTWDGPLDCSNGGRLGGLAPSGKEFLFFRGGCPAVTRVDARNGKPIIAPEGHLNYPTLVWMPDRKTIMARAQHEHTWSVWNVQSGRRERQFGMLNKNAKEWCGFDPVGLSPDGKVFVDLNSEEEIRIGMKNSGAVYDPVNGEIKRMLFGPGHSMSDHQIIGLLPGQPSRVVFGNCIVGKGDFTCLEITLWNWVTETKESCFEIDFGYRHTRCCVGSYLAKYVFTPNDDFDDSSDVILYDLRDGKRFRTLHHTDRYPEHLYSIADCGVMLSRSCPSERSTTNQRNDSIQGPSPRYHFWELNSGKEISFWSRTRYAPPFSNRTVTTSSKPPMTNISPSTNRTLRCPARHRGRLGAIARRLVFILARW